MLFIIQIFQELLRGKGLGRRVKQGVLKNISMKKTEESKKFGETI